MITGCSLSADGLALQRGRAGGLREHVESVDRRDGELRVHFGRGVDEALLAELIAVERECCSFLAIDYEAGERVLRIATDDPERVAVLDTFAEALA